MTGQAHSLRLLCYTTVFGVCWGVVEMFLGTYLHMMRFPLKGAIMAAIGVVILCVERTYTPVFRASLYTGAVAMLCKFASMGAVRLSPALAIIIQSLLAEVILTSLGLRKSAFILTGILSGLEGVPHYLVSAYLRYGSGFYSAARDAAERLAGWLGLSEDLWIWMLAAWAGGHLLFGLLAGLVAIKTAEATGRWVKQ